jgi:hypothetical protein
MEKRRLEPIRQGWNARHHDYLAYAMERRRWYEETSISLRQDR